MKYRIYYSDGRYSGPPELAPVRDVQVILQPDKDVGWYFQTGSDFYVWWGERWLGVDKFGLMDYLMEPGWKRVLIGRTINNDEYRRIYQEAKEDRDLARKSGYLPGERK